LRQRTEPVRGSRKFSGLEPIWEDDDDTTVTGTAVASLQSLPPMEDEESKQAACPSEGSPESATKQSADANIVPCPNCGAGVTGIYRFCPCCCSPLEFGSVSPPPAGAVSRQRPSAGAVEGKLAAWRSKGSSKSAPNQMAVAKALASQPSKPAEGPECPSCRARVDNKYKFCPCCCSPLQQTRAAQPAAYMPCAMVPTMVMQNGRQMWFMTPTYGMA